MRGPDELGFDEEAVFAEPLAAAFEIMKQAVIGPSTLSSGQSARQREMLWSLSIVKTSSESQVLFLTSSTHRMPGSIFWVFR